jgi:hypothetical protein
MQSFGDNVNCKTTIFWGGPTTAQNVTLQSTDGQTHARALGLKISSFYPRCTLAGVGNGQRKCRVSLPAFIASAHFLRFRDDFHSVEHKNHQHLLEVRPGCPRYAEGRW